MTINRYTGKTKEEAINSAKEDLGPSTVIMNVREIRPGGIFGIFRKSTYEVTAAIEDDYKNEDTAEKKPPFTVEKKSKEAGETNFSAVADEKIDLATPLPPVAAHTSAIDQYRKQEKSAEKQSAGSDIDADELKSVFDEVSKVIQAPSERKEDEPEKKPEQKEFIPLSAQAAIAHNEEKRPAPAPKPAQPEKRLKTQENEFSGKGAGDYLGFTRMLYNTLVDHEVDEIYINALLSDIDTMIEAGNSIDYLISNVYQKMVLKTGQPQQISLNEDTGYPAVVFLVGPTGVGKTTTLAKLASSYKVNQKKKVAFLTADTYRIAATKQLAVYADILDVSSTVLMTPDDIVPALGKSRENDVVFVDTVGFSHTNDKQRQTLAKLLSLVPEKYKAQIYLVLSATTKYNDLKKIVDAYSEFTDFSLLFTKLDETADYGNLYNIRQYCGKSLSYITNGQNVPEDFAVLDPQKLVKNLLGGSD